MDKLKMQSADITEANVAKLAELFPHCVTETRDAATGKVKRAIDFDLLRQDLSDSAVEGQQERYQLNWPGKREALITANTPINKTLRPCVDESVNFDTTKNLFIEGDNLEALKLLQETYLGKVKMIYIDPPYNTGNDFIYNDTFTMDKQEYDLLSGQRDEDGQRLLDEEKFRANTASNGRFHSDWLSMMYPRLKLAHNLLRDDGVIFISIDDAECSSLKHMGCEIFGEENFIACLVWEKGRKNDAKLVSVGHEYMLVFAKNKQFFQAKNIKWREVKPGASEILAEYVRLRNLFGKDDSLVEQGIRDFYEKLPKSHPSKKHSRYNKIDNRGVWRDDNMSWPGGGGPSYDVIHPTTGIACLVPEGGWRYGTPEKMHEMIQQGKVIFRADHTEPPIRKTYLVDLEEDQEARDDSDLDTEDSNSEDLPIQVAGSYFYRSALQASSELNKLFGNKVFNNPKDRDVISRWTAYVGTTDNDIVVDFFAGSGTTAHAILGLNAAEQKSIRYILIQLPEKINPKAKGTKLATTFLDKLERPYLISEISKERIRRAGAKIKADNAGKEGIDQLDIGFRVLKIDSSNMAEVYYSPEALSQDLLESAKENIKEGRTAQDLLFQVMLDWGIDLALPIRQEQIDGKTVFFVDDNALAACFDDKGGVDEALVKQLATRQPLRVVFRDAGFKSDSVKINIEQIFKLLSPTTDIKTI